MQNNSRTSDRANKEQETKKQFPKEQEDIPSNLTLNHNLRVMWMDGWVMSNCSQDSQNVCTKLLSLPDKAKKKINF